MNPSAPDLIRAVAACLEEELLPRFEAATWTASNLRSCLAILAYLEERVANEGPALHADNQNLRHLLGQAANAAGLARELAHDIHAAMVPRRRAAPYPSVGELAAENDRYRSLLERYIAWSAQTRLETAAPRTPLDEAIRAYLLDTAALDFAPMARAAAMPAI